MFRRHWTVFRPLYCWCYQYTCFWSVLYIQGAAHWPQVYISPGTPNHNDRHALYMNCATATVKIAAMIQ